MLKLRSLIVRLLAITLLPGAFGCFILSVSFDGSELSFQVSPQAISNRVLAAEPDVAFSSSQPSATTRPVVTLRAASGATIRFKTQNGQAVGDIPPQTFDLPQLVLTRNGVLTAPEERTLIVEVSGIEVPPAGVTITLKVETQHGDPDLDGDPGTRISVWRESRWINNASGAIQTGVTAVFTHQFGGTAVAGTERLATPTDYFRYDIAVIDGDHPVASPVHAVSLDHAFLMESQWIAPLPTVQEASDGAAPDELAIYYCDMVPFQKSSNDSTTWLPRERIPDYVHNELVPQMVEAVRVQTDDWGFPWYQAWTGYRLGEDAERLTVALVDGRTWFHGPAPSRGHSGISIRVAGGMNTHYDTLTQGIMSTFHHELFHSLQRNINLNNGGDGDVDGGHKVWRFFSEGTAVLASSVGQPVVQFTQVSKSRAYMPFANRFLGGGCLNRSYERMRTYYSAIYWRFLYEQCGGMTGGAKDPASGMEAIRHALAVLYSGDVVDITASTDLVENVPEILDRALEGSSCPFQTYEESLIGFARAISMLRLHGGRCTELGMPAGCGFYDPNDLYRDPTVSTITYAGADQHYSGEIGSSFGIDLIDVVLDPASDGQSLALEFYGAPDAGAQFNVQLWSLIDSGDGSKPQRIPTQTTAPEVIRADENGRLNYVFPALDTTAYNRLGLIITRVDANESSDPVGEYTIVLRAGADRE